MLTPCVSCSTLFYTEESPLWFHCDKCLTSYRKQQEKNRRTALKELYNIEMYTHCDSCGYEYSNDRIYISSDGNEYCKSCLLSFKHMEDEYEAE